MGTVHSESSQLTLSSHLEVKKLISRIGLFGDGTIAILRKLTIVQPSPSPTFALTNQWLRQFLQPIFQLLPQIKRPANLHLLLAL
jgi:hypothetical protein